MKNKKAFALLLSIALVLGVALPGTMAVSVDTNGTESGFSIDEVEHNITDEPLVDVDNNDGTVVNGDTVSDNEGEASGEETIVDETLTSDGESETGDEVPPADETPVLDDESSDSDDSTVDQPADEESSDTELTCTCGTAEGVHADDCPLNEAPAPAEIDEEIQHIETCVGGCTGDGCKCECHALSLYERLMACSSLEEIGLVLDEATDEELPALTDEEIMEIEEHINTLEPEPLPAVVIGESTDEPVESEIVYPTVSFTNVAPFGDPVVGGAN